MIYEYPEEYIVPVVYESNISDKEMYRNLDVEYIELKGVLFPNNEPQESGVIIEDGYKDKILHEKEKKFSEFELDLIQEPYKKSMINYEVFEDESKKNNVKAIFDDIDNEYAKSETSKR